MTDVPLLIVASGLQKGAKVSLPQGESRIGSDPDCSVVVVDTSLEPCHLRVVVEDVVQLRCDSAVVLSDGTTIAPGGALNVSAGCRFTAGSTEFELAMPAQQQPARTIRSRRILVLALAGMAALGGAILVGATVMHGSIAAAMPSEPEKSPHLVQSNGSDTGAALAFLRQHADAAGLALKMTVQVDGGIVVEGELPAKQHEEWQAIRQQYDQRFAMSHVLLERLTAPDEQPSLRLAAVWSGPDPYVVDEHGERLRVGASLRGGWSIESIDAEQLVIRLRSRRVALKY